MPDISMCQNITCPLRFNCYRYTAKPSEHRQTWAPFQWKAVNGKAECSDFLPPMKHPTADETAPTGMP